ncbi:MAG: PolC-type DNA polymerase III, partial [Parasporobacterium sp.]|nr:PolC-type DNA polymerase III [Parasporobacterium sp.]
LIRNYNDPKSKGFKAENEEALRDLNRKVIELGEKTGKKVVATGDVHFLDPEDQLYRHILLDSQHYGDADEDTPLYFRTTDEMLEEFSYLGEEKAREIVIDNPNIIADSIEQISPIYKKYCPPVIENSDQQLTDIVYETAKSMYGDPLPQIVKDRLEFELNSIISHDYAVLYIIAMKLVVQSVKDGYLVGSRGSVGSSLVATMSGITEVNPLSPHYRCPRCLYSDFDSPEVKAFAGGSGCDMPDKVCPVCGEPLLKEGFDIPFETFMGFGGNKEPDIDLNFSGDYQAQAHANTEKLFGRGHTFRAGTIGSLQDKTVFGYVKNYMEKHNRNVRRAEINRLVKGCVNIKRGTGQHPGGIVVLPHGEEIYSITPVQYPA